VKSDLNLFGDAGVRIGEYTINRAIDDHLNDVGISIIHQSGEGMIVNEDEFLPFFKELWRNL